MIRFALLIGMGLALVGFGDVAAAAFPGGNGKIAFTSFRDGPRGEIYVMNADGTGQTNLTQLSTGFEDNAAWSPAGDAIAFTSDRDGQYEIYRMAPDGSGQTRLTTQPGTDDSPAWSPDGGRLAFASTRTGSAQLFTMGADGSAPIVLSAGLGPDTAPAWSPDGTRVAFSALRNGNFEVVVMNTDGTGEVNLTDHPGADESPAWSPDGSKLAFASNRSNQFEIWVMDADGSDVTRLTINGGFDGHPAWSPDGTMIAFTSVRFGNNLDIYAIDADGTNTRRLTIDQATDRDPDWQPIPPADAAAPAIAIHTPADGVRYLRHSGLNADFSCSDEAGGSGLASCVGTVADDATIDTTTLGTYTFTVTARDEAGNTSTLTHTYEVIDGTAPAIFLTSPADGADYLLGSSLLAEYSCSDEAGGSGLAACTGTEPSGTALDTSAVGPRSFTVAASDQEGNRARVTHAYRVIYDFRGFFGKVDNPPAVNELGAGAATKLRFTLAGYHGMGVLAPGSPRTAGYDCDTGSETGAATTAEGTGPGLAFDPETGQYQFNWKTDRAWSGTCRRLDLELADGTHHYADFRFR